MRYRFPLLLLPAFLSAVLVWAVLVWAVLVWAVLADRAPDEPAPRGVPGLELSDPVVRLGRLASGEVRQLAIPWRRTGAGTLRLLGVRTGCGCVVAEAPHGALPPGARGVVRLRLEAGRLPGPFVHRVRVFTDGPPPAAQVTCRLVGHVEESVALVPATLHLGRRTGGSRVERLVELRAAEPLPGALGFAWSGLTGAVTVEPAARPDLPGALLRLVIVVPPVAGPFRGQVAVLAGAEVLAVLRIRGVVD